MTPSLGLEIAIASGGLGTHRGHPVTVVATTTLTELDQAAHAAVDSSIQMPTPARTGGGSRLPMPDLIRMAAKAVHYLAVFDEHTGRPLYLGRQKRIASADQRSSATRGTAAAPIPFASNPGITARFTMRRSRRTEARQTQTTCTSRAGRITAR